MKKQLQYTSLGLLVSILGLMSCVTSTKAQSPTTGTTTLTQNGNLKAEIWADNWFALYVDGKLVAEDSTPITTERSFNQETFYFQADQPVQMAVIIKDFKENDTGLEYIGSNRQQMGDGGFIAQFTQADTHEGVAFSNTDWKCLAIHQAPLDKGCEQEANPVAGSGKCTFKSTDEPEGWKNADFDDSQWPNAKEYSVNQVSPKEGYNEISWDPKAKLIWGSDLETDNTLLCRATLKP